MSSEPKQRKLEQHSESEEQRRGGISEVEYDNSNGGFFCMIK